MLKTVICGVILLVFCSIIAAQQCYTIKCVGANQQCSLTDTTSIQNVCSDTTTTCLQTGTSNITGTCKVLSAAGQFCNHNADCQYPLNCWSNMCNRNYYPGASCKNNYDCYYPGPNGANVTSCVNGQCAGVAEGDSCVKGDSPPCSPPNICGVGDVCVPPVAVNGACDSQEECQLQLVCRGGQCVQTLAVGSTCAFPTGNNDDPCDQTAQCTPNSQNDTVNGVCVEYYSQAAGGLCDKYDGSSAMCGDGLTCLFPTDKSPWGTCGTVTNSFNACNSSIYTNNPACNTNEVCACSYISGTGICISSQQNGPVPTGTMKAYLDAISCAIKNCQSRDDYGCISKHCGYTLCNLFELGLQHLPPVTAKTYPACAFTGADNYPYIPGYLTCSGNSAGLLHISAIVVLFGILAAILL